MKAQTQQATDKDERDQEVITTNENKVEQLKESSKWKNSSEKAISTEKKMFSSNPMHSASSVPPGDYEFIGIATTSQEHLTRVAKVFRIVVVVVVAELSIFVIGSVERGISFEGFIQLAISLAVSRTRGFFLSNSFSPCDSFFPPRFPTVDIVGQGTSTRTRLCTSADATFFLPC